MKKIYLTGALSFALATAYCQSMNENFDSYTPGSYMGINSAAWTTWGSAPGTSQDTQVSTTQAYSGSNSIYFVSTSSSGGPQDVVVPFGGAYNTGQFVFEAMFYVLSNKGAYFNFQGNTTVGQKWSLNCQMVNDGNLVMDDGAGNSLSTTYPQNTWFKLTIDINLNTNEWELLLDDVSQGMIQNDYNQVASIDIYPVNSSYGGNNQCTFYIDDFTYNHTPYTLPSVNGAVTAVGNVNGIAGIDLMPTVTVRNLGTTAITSFDLTIDYNGNQIVENVTGVNIASLSTYDVDFSSAISLVSGSMAVTATISNVNGGGPDGDAADDSKVIMIDPVVPAAGKVVVAEEGTGTWCQWCPRGAVFMDMMSEKYDGFFAPIAVHNNDPMTYAPYDAGMGGLISGYPSALVDRGTDIDPSGIEQDFFNRITLAPKAFITNGAQYNATTGLLEVSITADFQQNISGNYKLACVITEDNVTGTGSQWSQSNAYSGGSNGEMGGFELLPNPVPASQMVYDHVARIILPGFSGLPNSFPSTVAAGETHTVVFHIAVPSTWDINELNIVGLLITPTGKIDNAGVATLAEAETNGLVASETIVGIEESAPMNNLSVYPNPADDFTQISIGNVANENVVIRIYDINGSLVAEKYYGELSGNLILPINTELMNSGVYMVQVSVGDNQQTSRLVVQ